MLSRRAFVSACAGGVVTAAYPIRVALSHACAPVPAPQRTPHPKPRAGSTGAKVWKAAQLKDHAKLIPLFASVRKIPHIVDGIRCNCLCAHPPGMYSLLSCYEGDAMAIDCAVCQGQGRLAARLHAEGKSLADIRVAIDAKFG